MVRHPIRDRILGEELVPVEETGTIEEPRKDDPEKDEEKRIKEIQKEMGRIETESNGFGNIPMDSEYWSLKNELQSLQAE